MAFLQIKKDYHLDKPLIVRLDQEPIDVRGEKNRFDNLEFKILATNLGEDYDAAPYGDKEPFTIRKGDQFDLVMSSSLYKKINDYELCNFHPLDNTKTIQVKTEDCIKFLKTITTVRLIDFTTMEVINL